MRSIVAVILFAFIVNVHALPEPRSGGKDGGPVSVLFLMGAGAAGPLSLDATVEKKLKDRGYVLHVVGDREPLAMEYLRQFSVIVLGSLDDFNGGNYYNPGGVTLVNAARNVKLLQQYVDEGGGLVVFPGGESGSIMAATYDAALAPWKVRMGWEVIVDEANLVNDPADPQKKLEYAWTKNITASPMTQGVRALAYPSCVSRWDDIYPNVPVFPEDPAWQVLVRGEKSSKGMRMGNARRMVDGDAGAAPAMVVARDAGKGRVVVFGIMPYYLLSHAFAEKDDKGKRLTNIGESTTGPLEGIAFEKGDGTIPSDWGVLLDNLLRWSAEASAKAGLGGKPAPWVSKLQRVEFPGDQVPPFAFMDWKTQDPSLTWAHHAPTPAWWRGNAFYDEIPDPMAPAVQKMNRVLVGARSAYSGGKGTVADWAKAAKAAGFSVVVFTERFEDFKAENWPKYINECNANSDAEIACLQGLDIADSYGNRYLICGNLNFPSGGMLTPDGKALEMTARLSLGFAHHIAVMHRCGESKLSKELYRHFQAISVYTYADKNGKFQLADDGMAAYRWHLDNAGNPVPVVVHELSDPADVAVKGTMGFQLIVPAQDALDARRYFRYGMAHFFENPQRYFITEGPIIDAFSIVNKDIGDPALNRDHWRAVIGARVGDPTATLVDAVLYDRGVVARRWTPDATAFAQMIDGEHGHQRHFMLVVTDNKGRKAISPHLRTVARGYYTRCADRQNWFGAAGSYTGIWPSGTHGINFINPIVAAGADTEQFGGTNHPLATKMSLPFASDAMTFTAYTVNERYLRPVTYGMDAWAIHNTEPSKTYDAEALVGKWHDIQTGQFTNPPLDKVLAVLTTVDARIRTKMAIKPATNVTIFPAINYVEPTARYTFIKDGAVVTGSLDRQSATLIDLPAGASIGSMLLLTPLTVAGNGHLGWRADSAKEVPVGTEWQAGWMYLSSDTEWRAAVGAQGATPWSLNLSQGKVERTLGLVDLQADKGGVVGTLKAGGKLAYLPLRIKGLNDNWPAAVWTPKGLAYYMWSGLVQVQRAPQTLSGTFLQHMGVYTGVGYGVLENSKDTTFYAGNTLTATSPDLILAFTYWTDKEAGIEVNNPTDKEIKARITSPDAIKGNVKVDTEVTVPAGSSLRFVFSGK